MNYSRSELTNAINEWIHNERDRKIVTRRLIDGIKYEPLAEEFDLSVRWVKEIVRRSIEILDKHL